MKFYPIFFVVFFLFNLITTAQEIKLETGKPYERVDLFGFLNDKKVMLMPDINYTGIEKIINKNTLIKVQYNSKKIILQKFNITNLVLEETNSYDDFPDKISQSKLINLKNHVYFIYATTYKNEKTEYLYAREIDINSAKFIEAPRILLSIEGSITEYNFTTSYDSSKFAVQYDKKTDVIMDKNNYVYYEHKVFNASLGLIGEANFTMPYPENISNINYFTIDNLGNIYFLIYTKTIYELVRIKANSTKYSITPIKYNDLDLLGLTFLPLKDNSICCIGRTSSSKHFATNKFFLANFTIDSEISYKGEYEIPESIIVQNLSEKDIKVKKKNRPDWNTEINNLIIHSLIVEDSCVLIADEEYTSYSEYLEHCDHILLTKIRFDGKLEWMIKIPKKQYNNMILKGISFVLVNGTNYYHVVFLDNNLNVEINKSVIPEVYMGGEHGNLVDVRIDKKTGNSSLFIIKNTKELPNFDISKFIIRNITPIEFDEFVLESYKNNTEDVLIKVNLKK